MRASNEQEQEREANQFALALLMPERMVREWLKVNGTVGDDDDLDAFCKAFQVPRRSAIARLMQFDGVDIAY